MAILLFVRRFVKILAKKTALLYLRRESTSDWWVPSRRATNALHNVTMLFVKYLFKPLTRVQHCDSKSHG